MKYKYHIYIILNLISAYYFVVEYNFNESSELSFLFAFFIHSTALLLSINLLKQLRLPFTLSFSILAILTYVFSAAFTDFQLFQLGVFEPRVLNELNIGFLLFYTIYFLIIYGRIRNKNKTKTSYEINLPRIHFFLFVIYLLQIFVKLQINGINEIIVLYTIGLFLYGFIKNKNGWIQNFLLVSIVLYETVTTIIVGLIFPLVYLALFIVTVTYIFGKFNRKVISVIVVSSVTFISFSIVFTPVRMQFRAADLDGKSTIDKLLFVNELISKGEKEENSNNEEDYRNTFWRLTYPLSAVSMVEKKTPMIVPYWEGESYEKLFYKFIPRFIWKDKPSENSGQEFGHRYFILDDTDKKTSMNTPIIAEAYMNYGYFGMFLIFVFMAFLMSSFSFSENIIYSQQKNDSLEYVLSGINICMAGIFFTQWESNLSMLVGKLIIIKATEFIIHWLYFRKQFI
jgi:hypothetical protein